MDRLEQIKNEVAQEKYNTSWDDLLYDMHPDDTYVNDALSRYEIDVMMEEVARRYATEMVRHNLERAAESARIGVVVPKELEDAFDDLKDGDIDISVDPERLKGCKLRVSKQSITSLEIELI